MKNSRLYNVSIGIGGSLILVIFVVLCLTIFSVLSFTTAYSDLKLSKKTEQITIDYYDVHGKAEEKLSEICELLDKYDESPYAKFGFNKYMEEKMNKINGVTVLEQHDKDVTVNYEVLGDRNQKINVTLKLVYDEVGHKKYYEIMSWNLANIEIPEYEEETVDLWEGTE